MLASASVIRSLVLLAGPASADTSPGERALSLRYYDTIVRTLESSEGLKQNGRVVHAGLELGAASTASGATAVPFMTGGGRHNDLFGFHVLAWSPALGDSELTVVSTGLYLHSRTVHLTAQGEWFPSSDGLNAFRLGLATEPVRHSQVTVTAVLGDTDRWTDGGTDGSSQVGALRVWAGASILGRVHLGTEVDGVSRQLRVPLSTSLWHLFGADAFATNGGQHAPKVNVRLRVTADRGGLGLETGPSVKIKDSRTGDGGTYAYFHVSYFGMGYFDGTELEASVPDAMADLGRGLGLEGGIHYDHMGRFTDFRHLDPFDSVMQVCAWYNSPPMSWNGDGHMAGLKARILY